MTKTLLQIPDGLKTRALEIAKEIGNDVIISADACFGACDLKDREALQLKCDKIIHYGHSKFLESEMPVEYREMKLDIDIIPLLDEAFEKLNQYKSFGLVTTIQFINSIQQAKEYLESKGKTVEIKQEKDLSPGQILGCRVPTFDTECILYIGSGRFHAAGIALKNKKPLFILDIEKNILADVEDLKNKFEKQSYAAIAVAKDKNSFGILVSTKKGQCHIDLAEEIKSKLKAKGKEAFILSMDEIKPEKLMGIKCDVWINTACPRIGIEDRTNFEKPILNPDEIQAIVE